MAGNLRYWSFKTIYLKESVPFVAILLSVAVIVLLSLNPPSVLFGAFVGYAIFGYVVSAWLSLHRRRAGGGR
jgi:CDP-diacylglycerol--serine O-phosphatidyltransferase